MTGAGSSDLGAAEAGEGDSTGGGGGGSVAGLLLGSSAEGLGAGIESIALAGLFSVKGAASTGLGSGDAEGTLAAG